MVNLVEAQKPLLHGLMKMAGIRPTTVEIEPGTSMTFWVPAETLKNPSKKPKKPKPAVVLIHGFAAEGIVTWQFQVGALTKKYAVYVPDLLFFGGSTTNSSDRSPTFQAECLAAALGKLGVTRCTLVGFSYGGMVAFKMAEMRPDLVEAMVVSGSILAMTESISEAELNRMGFQSSSDLLLPTSIDGLKTLLKIATHKKLWFPDRMHKDYLKVMFANRKERSELLEALVIAKQNPDIPYFPQRIHLLWGESDQIFRTEIAQQMKEKLGENATYEGIKKAGHLVHLERPCVYNRCLKRFLATLYEDYQAQK
uniref:AB hydrolase-1 domain-containing protein n=1 Tax=Opuntia streptacantha TaxID=393608 RepID=A0A7C8YQL5_OPUST